MIESIPPVRRLPAWLSVLLIAVALAGGSYVIFWFFQSSSAAQDIVLDRDPNDYVKVQGINKDHWEVRAGDAKLQISGKEKPQFDFLFSRQQISSEQNNFLSLAKRLVRDRMLRQSLGITSGQEETLKKIQGGAMIALSDADKSALAAAFKDYLRGSDTSDAKAKDRSETRLINVVEEVARPIAMARQKSNVERAEMARTLLTPDQLKQYEQMGK